MAGKKRTDKHSDAGVTIQLHLLGIVVFSVSLVLASALVTFGFVKIHAAGGGEKNITSPNPASGSFGIVDIKATNLPAWGQLIERDIDLEQPDEYVAYEINTNRAETWTFAGMNPDAARAVMQSSGLTADQIQEAVSAAAVTYTNLNTIITPDQDLVFSLSPDVRAKLYTALGRFGENELMQFPFCFPGNSFATGVDKTKISVEALALLQKMIYPRGDALCFSDLGVLLRCIPDEPARMQMVKALSHQSAVLMGVRVWPDTDTDKIIGYWSVPNGVRLMDVRPLLDSLKREPNGGYASILYFLPPFARARLYTYPLPTQPGDPSMDCHWTTMNFFNESPDNRFSDPKYTVDYLLSHFYKIGKPTMYGDRVFVLNKNGDAIHSAVYLADDIVFTKNGNNSEQPWMLMHLKNLLAEYSADGPPDIVIYRDKNW